MVSFKQMAKAGEHTPDRFLEYPHKNLYDIQDSDVIVEDYELFTSSNLAKYDNNNAEGVIILIKVFDTGEECTIVTHAKSLVRAFKNIKNRGITKLDEEIVQFHLGETTSNGKTYPQWQIV